MVPRPPILMRPTRRKGVLQVRMLGVMRRMIMTFSGSYIRLAWLQSWDAAAELTEGINLATPDAIVVNVLNQISLTESLDAVEECFGAVISKSFPAGAFWQLIRARLSEGAGEQVSRDEASVK